MGRVALDQPSLDAERFCGRRAGPLLRWLREGLHHIFSCLDVALGSQVVDDLLHAGHVAVAAILVCGCSSAASTGVPVLATQARNACDLRQYSQKRKSASPKIVASVVSILVLTGSAKAAPNRPLEALTDSHRVGSYIRHRSGAARGLRAPLEAHTRFTQQPIQTAAHKSARCMDISGYK